jgi:hypothetical protein
MQDVANVACQRLRDRLRDAPRVRAAPDGVAPPNVNEPLALPETMAIKIVRFPDYSFAGLPPMS